MSESQYQTYHDAPKVKLGSMCSQRWIDDPKMLGIVLARYGFVAKMVRGKQRVGEIGCGDGWAAEIVRINVGELWLYDFDKKFIDEIYARRHGLARVHNILDGKLEEAPFDALYSLDCFEHIEKADTKELMDNVCESLHNDGMLIVGMPSLESQQYASPPSRIGHVSCRSQEELRAMMGEWFKTVLMFGMNDTALHTGFGPMCHYILAIGVGIK